MRALPLRLFANAAVVLMSSLTPCLASAQESNDDGPPLPALPPNELTTSPPDANANAPIPSTVHAAPRTASAWVHLDGPHALEIQADLDSVHHGAWETVCSAPCDRPLSSDLRYRLTGGGLRTSEPFALTAPEGTRERIAVRGGSKAWFIVGWIGVGVGGAVVVVGLDVLIAPVLSSILPSTDGPSSTSNHPGHPLLGWSLVGGGIALALGSLAAVVSNRHSTITQETTSDPIAPPESQARAELHLTGKTLGESLPPPTVVVPILQTAF